MLLIILQERYIVDVKLIFNLCFLCRDTKCKLNEWKRIKKYLLFEKDKLLGHAFIDGQLY